MEKNGIALGGTANGARGICKGNLSNFRPSRELRERTEIT
jgi:hypothetical protein